MCQMGLLLRILLDPVGDASKDEEAWTEHRYNHTHPSGVGSKSEKRKC